MPATERYQVDIFAIIVLISAVLIIVFLIIAAIYYFNLMSLKPPSKGESTFLFWTTIVLAIIFMGIAIYALIRIFTHKSVVYEEPKVSSEAKQPPPKPTTVTPPSPSPTIQQTTAAPIKISNIPKTARPTNESVSLSDIPVTSTQLNSLNQELINLADITGGP